MDLDVDVVVVGSGAAGLCAALSAVESGARRVLVAEAEEVVGGSSRLSGGLIMGAGTRYQAAAGIEDSGEALLHDYLQINRWNVDVAVVRAFCERTGAVVDWLGDLGVEFHEHLVVGSDESVPRVHVPVGNGQAIIDVLHRACREREIDIALGQRVDRLVVEDGRVTGVAVGDDEISAGAVVLATGGFGNAPEKLADHFPSAAATGWTWYLGADGARGDALDLADQVGAQVTGHDHGLRLLHAGYGRDYEALLPGWMVLVDADGHRFVDETAPYGIMDFLVRERGDRVFVVFDQATLDAIPTLGPDQFPKLIPGHGRRMSKNWNPDVIELMRQDGRVVVADDLPTLAERLGVDADGLSATIVAYNGFVDAGADDQFGKDPHHLRPVATAPLYGAELRPATVCSTAYGLRITPRAEVLGVDGRPIPGLYAAGECTGGVVGAQYVGSGNNYANCCAVGHLAGERAATGVGHLAGARAATAVAAAAPG